MKFLGGVGAFCLFFSSLVLKFMTELLFCERVFKSPVMPLKIELRPRLILFGDGFRIF